MSFYSEVKSAYGETVTRFWLTEAESKSNYTNYVDVQHDPIAIKPCMSFVCCSAHLVRRKAELLMHAADYLDQMEARAIESASLADRGML